MLYQKHSSLRNRINLNLSDHVRFFGEKIWWSAFTNDRKRQ